MSENNSTPQHQQQQQADDAPSGTQRPARSGEGLDSVITRLREQEDERGQNDPGGGN